MRVTSGTVNGDFFVTTDDDTIKVMIEVESGRVTDIVYTEDTTIQQLASFTSTARTRYNKFMISKEAEKFKY